MNDGRIPCALIHAYARELLATVAEHGRSCTCSFERDSARRMFCGLCHEQGIQYVMGTSWEIWFGALLVIALVAMMVWRFLRILKMRKWNLAWYRREFPNLVGRDGRVTCYACNSSNVGTERLMEGMYMRRHLCRQCGTTLYYSPES